MSGILDDKDVAHWKDAFNDVLARPGEHLQSHSGPGAASWGASFWGCCSPLELCLVSWCLPCVTFGKTHHRLVKDAHLQGYEPINTSCLLFCGAACCGLHWVPAAMQRAAIRARYNVGGSCVVDLAAVCCCPLCALVQEEKEVERHGAAGAGAAVQEEYKPAAGMAYPGGDAAPAAAPAAAAAPAP